MGVGLGHPLLLHQFPLPLHLDFLVHRRLLRLELLGQFLLGEDRPCHPGTLLHLFQGHPLGRVVGQHAGEHVLEFGGEEVLVALELEVLLPEAFVFARGQEVVIGVLGVGSGEGGCSNDHNEEDDGGGEEVGGMGIVGDLEVDLRGHVGLSA